jgi:hypothetical protein
VERLLGTAPSDLVVSIVPNPSSGQLYDRLLTEAGLRAKWITIDQIQSLRERAGVVIIDGGIEQMPEADMFLGRSLERARLIGMGRLGGRLFREIAPDTVLAGLESERNDPVISGTPNL